MLRVPDSGILGCQRGLCTVPSVEERVVQVGKMKVDRSEFQSLFDRGYSRHRLAEYFDIDPTTVTQIARSLGLPKFAPAESTSGTQKIDEAVMLKALRSSSSTREVAEKVGCSLSTVNVYRARFGLPKFEPKTRSNQMDPEKVREMTELGMTAKQVAEELGVTPKAVLRVRSRLGIVKAAPPFSEQELRRADELLTDGASYKDVALTLGRSIGAIHKRFPGRGWTPKQCGELAGAIRKYNQKRKRLSI